MIKVKILNEDAVVPTKVYQGDAGFDVFSPIDVSVEPGSRKKIGLGLSVEIPDGYFLMMAEKSGMANNDGIISIGNIIDSNYRGEIHVVLFNSSKKRIDIKKCSKLAQMILIPCYTGKDIEVVDSLSNSNRGSGGFGSTGRSA